MWTTALPREAPVPGDHRKWGGLSSWRAQRMWVRAIFAGVLKGHVTLALPQSLNLAHQQSDLRLDPRRLRLLRDYFSPRSFHLTFCVLKKQAATRWRWSLNPLINFGKEALRGGPEAPGLFQNISPATFTRGSTRNLDAFGCSDWTIALLSLEETNEMRPAADR